MIDMDDQIIKQARANRRLFIATIVVIVVLAVANLIPIFGG